MVTRQDLDPLGFDGIVGDNGATIDSSPKESLKRPGSRGWGVATSKDDHVPVVVDSVSVTLDNQISSVQGDLLVDHSFGLGRSNAG